MIHWSTAIAFAFTGFNSFYLYRHIRRCSSPPTDRRLLMLWVGMQLITATWLAYFIYW